MHTEMFPNIGVASIVAYARKHGFDAGFWDLAAERVEINAAAKLVHRHNVRVFGMSCYTLDMVNAGRVARAIKAASPQTLVVVGGYHPSALPERTLQEFPSIDLVIFGEGEETARELLEAVESGAGVETVAGIAWRNGKEIVRNQPRPQLPSLDEIPFPYYDGLRLDIYKKMYSWNHGVTLPVNASRGCPYTCTFCYRSHGNRMRYRTVDNILAEVERDIVDYQANHIIFVDETFTLHKRRTHELCEGLIARGLHKKIQWMCETRVDAVTPQLLTLMKRAGCSLISYGVETGHQDTMDLIEKKITVEQVHNAFTWTTQAGLLSGANFIIGHPNDTAAKIKKTAAFARSIHTTYAQFAVMTPFPGTEIWEMAHKPGSAYRILSENWDDYGKQVGNSLELHHLTRRELERLQIRSYQLFYFRPWKVRRLLEIVDFGSLVRFALRTFVQSLRRSPLARVVGSSVDSSIPKVVARQDL